MEVWPEMQMLNKRGGHMEHHLRQNYILNADSQGISQGA